MMNEYGVLPPPAHHFDIYGGQLHGFQRTSDLFILAPNCSTRNIRRLLKHNKRI